MRRAAAIFVLAMAIGPGARAGEWDLGTDRDAFTPCTHGVTPGRVLVEASHVFIDNLRGPPTNNYPESLFRIGATEWLEWRIGANYGVGSQGTIVTSVEVGEGRLDGTTLYESSVLYGFKAAVTEQDGLLPEACFIMEASTPTSGDIFGTVPVATGVAGWELPNGWRLDTAIRYAYSEGLAEWFSRWSPSAVLRVPLAERLEAHIEWFGSYTAGATIARSEPYASPGFHVMLSRNLEMGLRVGWALAGETAPFFSDAGLGWRW